MKKKAILYLTACICMLVLGGCSSEKEDIPEPQPKPEADRISANPSTLSVGATEGTTTFSFNTNKANI